jgi:hypothetical protein
MISESRAEQHREMPADSVPDLPSTAQPAGSWVEWLGSAMLLLAPFAFFAALLLLDRLVRSS